LGKSDWIWANLIKVEQNQKHVSSKTFDLLRVRLWYYSFHQIFYWNKISGFLI